MHGQVPDADRDDSTPARQAFPLLAVVLFVGVLVIFGDLARGGPLLRLDAWVGDIWTFKGPYEYAIADGFDRIGQRLICLPLLFGVAVALSRRLRSIRPLVIAAGATFALNFVVGVLKLASGRESPRTGGPELFVGDNVLFPSGHTANVVFVYGLLVALLVRYGAVRTRNRRLLVAAVGLIFVFMTVVSVYRHTHWLSDLVAGGLIGGAMLQLSLAADQGWAQIVRRLRRIAGPSWVVVQWVVGLIRRPVMPDAPPPPEVLPPASDASKRAVPHSSVPPRTSRGVPDRRPAHRAVPAPGSPGRRRAPRRQDGRDRRDDTHEQKTVVVPPS